jgi:predicted amidohydrolase YtcJ
MTKMHLKPVLMGIVLFLCIAACANPENDPDLILFNGKIITVDPQGSIFKAMAIKNGRIIKLGEDAEIKSLAKQGCRMIDLKGKTATPGLVDSHYHVMYYGQQFWPGYLNIRHPAVRSKADLLKVVGDRAKQLNKDEWISGNQGFHLAMNETLDRYDLDKVAPQNPAYLRQGGGQHAVVNSRALEIAGITKNTPNPPSSLIVKDIQGEPTGVLSHYPAENMVAKFATGYGTRTVEEKIADIERGQDSCLMAGYTSVQDVIIGSDDDIAIYKNFADGGRLKVRMSAMLYLNTEEQVNNYARNYKPGNSPMFNFIGWKLAMDGGFAAMTVLLYDTTLEISKLSYPYFDQSMLNRMVSTLHNTGLQVAVHVMGDRGIDMTLTAFEEAIKKNPRPDPRHRIEHGIFPTTAVLQRMKDSKIILSTQPQWITWHGDGIVQSSNTATMNLLLPLKTMLGMGIPIAFGCDVPASLYQEPKYAFMGSVFRRTPGGVILNPDQRLTIQEALRIHTMGSAYASFADSVTGSLEPGKYADITVWSHDLYTMLPAEMMNLRSEMTIVDGKIMFNSGTLQVATGLTDPFSWPEGFNLMQNYPNPFLNFTTFRFDIPVSAKVSLCIFNAAGQQIKTLADGFYEAGTHSVSWNGKDDTGGKVRSGLYISEMRSGYIVFRKKITLLQE